MRDIRLKLPRGHKHVVVEFQAKRERALRLLIGAAMDTAAKATH